MYALTGKAAAGKNAGKESWVAWGKMIFYCIFLLFFLQEKLWVCV
jgi:hypothetical protein